MQVGDTITHEFESRRAPDALPGYAEAKPMVSRPHDTDATDSDTGGHMGLGQEGRPVCPPLYAYCRTRRSTARLLQAACSQGSDEPRDDGCGAVAVWRRVGSDGCGAVAVWRRVGSDG